MAPFTGSMKLSKKIRGKVWRELLSFSPEFLEPFFIGFAGQVSTGFFKSVCFDEIVFNKGGEDGCDGESGAFLETVVLPEFSQL